MDNIELPFTDIITGAIGLFSLIVIILALHSITNANITLNVDASKMNDKYPVFVICDNKNVNLICRSSYLPTKELQSELNEMCQSLKLSGIQEADFEQKWAILTTFLSSTWLNKEKFYIYSFIRPNGIATFDKLRNILEKIKLDVGYLPIAADWDIKEALKIE